MGLWVDLRMYRAGASLNTFDSVGNASFSLATLSGALAVETPLPQ